MYSFWGEFVYQDVVPEKHLLRQLNAVIDWEAFGKRLMTLYAGRGGMGRPPYHPVLLKMLLLAYLDDLSERQVEEHVQECSAIRLNRYRTQKKDRNKEVWQALVATPQYRAGRTVRYKIERTLDETKEYHGLRRRRSVGLLRHGIQAFLTALVLNLKRLVHLLTGVPFRGRAPAVA